MEFSGLGHYIQQLLEVFKLYFSDIQSYLPKSKISGTKDDPTSPYSINYSGEYNKNDKGYSYVITNENGTHSGYLKFTANPQPPQPLKISWPNLGNFRTGCIFVRKFLAQFRK